MSNLHVALGAQFARERSEDADGADRLFLVVDRGRLRSGRNRITLHRARRIVLGR